jgi:Flp pilus assembly protein TadG
MNESTSLETSESKHRSPRRGATLVLVAVLITMLISLAGLAIDASRMYAFKAQLKVLTDAAALAGALELKRGSSEAEGKQQAVLLKEVNKIEGFHTADLTDADVVPGQWSLQTGTFTPTGWTTASAVQVTARYRAEWSLARIFGSAATTIVEQSIASLGRASSGCVKPFILPYRALLSAAGLPPSTPLSHVLTDANLNALIDPTEASVPLNFPFTQSITNNESTDPQVGGNFQWIEHTDGASNSSGNKNDYLRDRLVGCMQVAVGQTLYGVTGDMSSQQVRQGVAAMCPRPTGLNPSIDVWDCEGGPVDISIPIGNWITGTGAGAEFSLQYIGGFKLKGMNADIMTGWLVDLRPVVGDGFMPGPGPIQGPGAGLVR